MVIKRFSDKEVYKLFLKEKIGIRCNTQEKCRALVHFVIEFIENDRMITDSELQDYKENTIISCEPKYGWRYADLSYYRKEGTPYVEFDDVIETEGENEH